MPKFGRFLLVLIATLVGASPAFGDALIIRAVGPSAAKYPAGKPLPTATALELKTGDIVVLLDTKGTRTFTGPGTFSQATSSSRDNSSALVALLRNSGARQVRTGAVRGGTTGDGPARPPSLWMIDVGQSGPTCLSKLNAVTLWRHDYANAADMMMSGGDQLKAASIRWRAGQQSTTLPLTSSLANGSSYQFQFAGQPPSKVTIIQLNAVQNSPTEFAHMLIENGCARQIDMMIAAGQ